MIIDVLWVEVRVPKNTERPRIILIGYTLSFSVVNTHDNGNRQPSLREELVQELWR